MTVNNANIRHHPEKAVPVRGMAQKSPFAGIVTRRIRGLSMTPHIRSPQFNARSTEFFRQEPVTDGMFRHAVYGMHKGPGRTGTGTPAPYKKRSSIIALDPAGGFNHRLHYDTVHFTWQ
jgi:hypothetical protein